MHSQSLSRQEFIASFVDHEHEVGKVELMEDCGDVIASCYTYRQHDPFEAGDVVVVHEYPGNPHQAMIDDNFLKSVAVWLCGEDGRMHEVQRRHVDQRRKRMVQFAYWNHFERFIHDEFITDRHVDRVKVIAFLNRHLEGAAA